MRTTTHRRSHCRTLPHTAAHCQTAEISQDFKGFGGIVAGDFFGIIGDFFGILGDFPGFTGNLGDHFVSKFLLG
jgi:hypothetical protein